MLVGLQRDMDFRMFGLLLMLMPTFPISGLSDRIFLKSLRSWILRLELTLHSSLTILRISFLSADNRDWGRDTQIIIDLVLSPDQNFGNRTRLPMQARDGSGVAVVLSAYSPSASN